MPTEKRKKQNARKCPKKRDRLSNKELEAIELSFSGMSVSGIVGKIGVDPKTYWRWRKKKKFQEAQGRRRREVLEAMSESTIGIVSSATEKLRGMVEAGDKDGIFKALDYFAKIGVFNELMVASFRLDDLKND